MADAQRVLDQGLELREVELVVALEHPGGVLRGGGAAEVLLGVGAIEVEEAVAAAVIDQPGHDVAGKDVGVVGRAAPPPTKRAPLTKNVRLWTWKSSRQRL